MNPAEVALDPAGSRGFAAASPSAVGGLSSAAPAAGLSAPGGPGEGDTQSPHTERTTGDSRGLVAALVRHLSRAMPAGPIGGAGAAGISSISPAASLTEEGAIVRGGPSHGVGAGPPPVGEVGLGDGEAKAGLEGLGAGPLGCSPPDQGSVSGMVSEGAAVALPGSLREHFICPITHVRLRLGWVFSAMGGGFVHLSCLPDAFGPLEAV